MQSIRIQPVILILLIVLTGCVGSKNTRKAPEPTADSSKAEELFRHIGEGDTKAVQSMVAAGFDPNVTSPYSFTGTTTLQYALNNIKMLKVLIAGGAHVNATNEYGSSALNWAANLGRMEAAQVLIGAGAHVNWQNHLGITPLMDATRGNHAETVKLLLANGADVQASIPRDGRTALMLASWFGYTEVAQVLLASGADVNAKSKDGKTALSIATEKGHADVVQLLKKAGAEK